MARAAPCTGNWWVDSLRAHTLVFTGRLNDGVQHRTQDWCASAAVKKKAAGTLDTFSQSVDLVVWGALPRTVVSDPVRGYSKKLIGAQEARETGRHVHVVSATGFFDLLTGYAARCLRLRRVPRGVEFEDEPLAAVFGPPPGEGRAPETAESRQAGKVVVDADSFGIGRVEHEKVCSSLKTFLERHHDVEFGSRRRSGPQFDLAWKYGRRLYIAEVKSLRGAREDSQIRLGLGQVLDYAEQTRHRGVRQPLRAVLAVGRAPKDRGRWTRLCDAHGVVLTWPPFAELRTL